MKIKKHISKWNNGKIRFKYCYIDNKTGDNILHGLYNDFSWWGIGYEYHNEVKGVWLCNKNVYL